MTLSIGDKTKEFSTARNYFPVVLLAGASIRVDFSGLSPGLEKREDERNLAMVGNELGHTVGFLPSLLYPVLGVHPNRSCVNS